MNVWGKLWEARMKYIPESEDCRDLANDVMEVYRQCRKRGGSERDCLWEAADEFVLGVDSLGHPCEFPEELRQVAERLGISLTDLLAL